MSENEESALIKLAVSVGKLEVTVAALDKKVDNLDSKMDAMTQNEAARTGANGARKNIFESYIKPFLFPIATGYALYWLTSFGSKMLATFDTIAKGGIKP
jgi:hypothetical protein